MGLFFQIHYFRPHNDFMLSVFQQKFYHNTYQEWLMSAAILLATIILARLIYWFINFFLRQLTSRTATKLDDIILEQIKNPALFAIVLTGLWYSLERLHFTDKADANIQRAFTLLVAINITWGFVKVLTGLMKEFLVPYSRRDDNELDEQLMGLLQQVVKIVLWSLGIVVGLNNAGFDVGALIAGLGIGGLALALASQDTVKNMFGGVILFLDKPFQIGDRVIIDGMDGHVVNIGIRSTRIKTLEGRLVTIPNAYFSEKPIQNFSQGPHFRVVNTLGLVYNTPYEKMEEALAILKEVVKDNEWLEGEPVVFFEQFGAYSLDIKFIYLIKINAAIFEVRSDINFKILKRFREAGLEFAYPTQTIVGKIETRN